MVMMKSVNVLISTYNGEKYITEQIESIIAQTYPSVTILVRDDGSTDGTVKILEEYEKKQKLHLFKGENVGYGKSFLRLLEQAEKGDYWAFCDQDDIWEVDKLQHAVNKLQTMEDNEPNLYVHDFQVADERMNPINTYGNNIPRYSFRMALTECLHMGFSTVFNRSFRNLMLQGNIDRIPSHDWWAELIAMEFGNIYVDDYIGAQHRRLDCSVSGSNLRNRIRWFRRALSGGSEIPGLAKEFYRTFGKDMNKKDRRIIRLFASEHYNLIYAIVKAFYPKRWRSSIVSEAVVRLLMLLGRI